MALQMCLCAVSTHTECGEGFSPITNMLLCSPPKCGWHIHQSNADWLTSRPEHQWEKKESSPGTGEAWKIIKDQKHSMKTGDSVCSEHFSLFLILNVSFLALSSSSLLCRCTNTINPHTACIRYFCHYVDLITKTLSQLSISCPCTIPYSSIKAS